MMKEALSHFPLPIFTVVGLLIFFTFFVGVLFWVYRRGSTDVYNQVSQIPLEEK